jgi:hypothetical protein
MNIYILIRNLFSLDYNIFMDTLIDDLLTPSDLRLRDDLGYDYTLSNIPVYNDKLFFLMNQSRDETELGKTRATNQQFNDLDKKIDIELNKVYG